MFTMFYIAVILGLLLLSYKLLSNLKVVIIFAIALFTSYLLANSMLKDKYFSNQQAEQGLNKFVNILESDEGISGVAIKKLDKELVKNPKLGKAIQENIIEPLEITDKFFKKMNNLNTGLIREAQRAQEQEYKDLYKRSIENNRIQDSIDRAVEEEKTKQRIADMNFVLGLK